MEADRQINGYKNQVRLHQKQGQTVRQSGSRCWYQFWVLVGDVVGMPMPSTPWASLT